MNAFKKILTITLLVAGCIACSSVPRIVTEYRIDVQQGNVLSQEAVAQLRPGLTMDQVRFLLGTPTLMDIFHVRRWDYVYRLQRGVGSTPVARRFSVFFDEAGLLQRVEGDLEPASKADLNVQPNRMEIIELAPAAPSPDKAQEKAAEKSGKSASPLK